jgi:hypothetical protein
MHACLRIVTASCQLSRPAQRDRRIPLERRRGPPRSRSSHASTLAGKFRDSIDAGRSATAAATGGARSANLARGSSSGLGSGSGIRRSAVPSELGRWRQLGVRTLCMKRPGDQEIIRIRDAPVASRQAWPHFPAAQSLGQPQPAVKPSLQAIHVISLC